MEDDDLSDVDALVLLACLHGAIDLARAELEAARMEFFRLKPSAHGQLFQDLNDAVALGPMAPSRIAEAPA